MKEVLSATWKTQSQGTQQAENFSMGEKTEIIDSYSLGKAELDEAIGSRKEHEKQEGKGRGLTPKRKNSSSL